MCIYMSYSLAAGDNICVWDIVMDGGSLGPPTENFEFGRCDVLYSGNPNPQNSFRFIA